MPTRIEAASTTGLIKIADKASATGTSGSSQVGAVVQLNSSEKIPSQYLSTGVHLGGIAAANLLDDYEEGTFTITSNANLSIASDSNGGSYTKIGNRCYVNFTCGVNTVSGTNHVFFPMPFTSAANTSGTKDAETVSLVGAFGVDLPTNAVQVYGKQEGGSNILYIYVDFDNAANAVLTNAALSSSSFLSITHSFKTT